MSSTLREMKKEFADELAEDGNFWCREVKRVHDAMECTPISPTHYKAEGYETWDYILAHDLGYLEGNVIKYVTRYKQKNGIEDLKKAMAYLNKLITKLEKENK